MTDTSLIMTALIFEEKAAHIDVLNRKCRELFDADPELLLIRVYRDGQHFEDNNLLGLIYRPGHSEYYRDCGEITWKYLRKLNEYDVAGEPDGDGVRIP
jgi:hypothetical protein